MIKIKRCQLRFGGIDTTVKSAKGSFKQFAPEWDWVLNHKKGSITDEEYTNLYLPKLSKAHQGWLDLYASSIQDEVTISCYCIDGKFCHTLLIGLYASLKWPHLFEDCTNSRKILSQNVIDLVGNYLK